MFLIFVVFRTSCATFLYVLVPGIGCWAIRQCVLITGTPPNWPRDKNSHWNTLFLVYIAFHCLLFWGAAKKCVCASIRNHHNPVDLVKCIEFQYINYVLCQVNANWILRVKKEQSRNINAYHTWLCEERKSEFFV